MTKAVDTVRKQEHREFLATGDDLPLSGTKDVWLFSDKNRPGSHAERFATLQALTLKVGRAWAIKEAFGTLSTYRQPAAVKRFLTRWYGWAVRSRLEHPSERLDALKGDEKPETAVERRPQETLGQELSQDSATTGAQPREPRTR